MASAKKGDTVKVKYTGKLEDGTVFDSSEENLPLSFTIGSGEVIPGFEEAVVGMSPGEAKNVAIPADRAYGPRNDDLVITAPRANVPADINPEKGQRLQLGSPSGELVIVEVVDVTDEHVMLDANPPLAGKDLNFDIELVEIA